MKINIIDKINRLRKDRNAVILAHYYTIDEVQDIADYLGDSLYLAQKAKETDADVIVFAGVHFMAETAKILNPTKTVLLPDMNAGCSLADEMNMDEFRTWRAKYPDSVLISYINCSTEVKAMSDIICTSSNAEKIVNSVPLDKMILFAPDRNLGNYLKKKLNREMNVWEGSCEVHREYSFKAAYDLKEKYPEAYFAAHPECPSNILDFVDFIGSTTAIINTVAKRPEKVIVLLTERGVIHELKKIAPDKTYIDVPNNKMGCNICPYMKMNTLEKIAEALEKLEPQINIDESLRLKALKSVERMLELSL
jgi:quinolinate synthase